MSGSRAATPGRSGAVRTQPGRAPSRGPDVVAAAVSPVPTAATTAAMAMRASRSHPRPGLSAAVGAAASERSSEPSVAFTAAHPTWTAQSTTDRRSGSRPSGARLMSPHVGRFGHVR